MRLLLLFLFLAYPILEIALMIKVGGRIGVGAVLLIVLATGILGVLVLRQNGVTMLRRLSEDMALGRPPVQSALNGALVGLAGLLLIAPGLITDAIGLLLLLPVLRKPLASWISRYAVGGFPDVTGADADVAGPQSEDVARSRAEHAAERTPPNRAGRRPRSEPIVIEGEFERIEERTIDPKKPERRD